jgi:D-alanyl-D-alanine carboxypeptidase
MKIAKKTPICLIITLFCSIAFANITGNTANQTKILLENFRNNTLANAASLSIIDNENKFELNIGTIENNQKNKPSEMITSHNLFQIGSITKSFIAAIIFQLEAEGKLSIDNTIEQTTNKFGMWLSEKQYAAWKNITIKQLLNMTSGIFSVTEDPDFNHSYLVSFPNKQWNPQEELDIALRHKPYFSPGAGWHYSDTNYLLLGLLIEAATKHTIEDEIKNRFIIPLNLKNTYYLPTLYSENIKKLMVHGYAYPGDFSPPAISGNDMTFINMSAANAAGAMVSNPSDIAIWIKALFTGKILPDRQLKEMMDVVSIETMGDICKSGKPFVLTDKCEGFGLGVAYLYHPELGQMWVYVGSTAGYYSAFMWLPKNQMALSLMVSSSSANSKKILKVLMEIARVYSGLPSK